MSEIFNAQSELMLSGPRKRIASSFVARKMPSEIDSKQFNPFENEPKVDDDIGFFDLNNPMARRTSDRALRPSVKELTKRQSYQEKEKQEYLKMLRMTDRNKQKTAFEIIADKQVSKPIQIEQKPTEKEQKKRSTQNLSAVLQEDYFLKNDKIAIHTQEESDLLEIETQFHSLKDQILTYQKSSSPKHFEAFEDSKSGNQLKLPDYSEDLIEITDKQKLVDQTLEASVAA